MKIEKLKKNHKKEIVIGVVITVCLISAITLVTTRAKYRVTQDIKLASGIVNYVPYDYKIMAMYQQNDSGEYIEIKEMPESGYVINEEKSYCNLASGSKDTTAVLKTIEGNHTISSLNKGDKCYVWFDKKDPSKEMLAKLNITPKDGTPDFTKIATTDEGVYSVSDGMYGGTSYYWRGASTTNHVIFANKCWRIVRINGDGTIRLIYNGAVSSGTCTGNGSNAGSIAVTSQSYNSSSSNSSYVGWTYSYGTQRPTNIVTPSNAKIQTESWLNSNVTGMDLEKVAIGKFCNDRSIMSVDSWSAEGSKFHYGLYTNRVINYSYVFRQPTLSCPNGDVYELKAGAITADEVMYAGGWSSVNTSYYLYNGQNYWTMSPCCWTGDSAVVLLVSTAGNLSNSGYLSNPHGLRPVINLKVDTTFSSGDGTQNNPYIVQ